ncbi:MAG TPA: MFS transporter [Methanomassiliicoccales archaeon]|nr:MFS transporter [Methanomassiliicoccales archaeon]
MADLRRVLVYSCAFIGTFTSNAVLALIPELRGYFQASTAEVLLSISFYMVFFAFFSIFTGSISDIIGRKKILVIGLVVYSLGCAMTALATGLPLFYASRAVQGLGFAFVQPVMVAVLGDVVTPSEKGRAMGWLTAATTGGVMLGPLIAGYAAAIDWRLAFIAIGMFSIALALLIQAVLRLPKLPEQEPNGGSLKENLSLAARRRGVVMLALTGFVQMMVWIATQAFASNALGQEPFLASPQVIGEVLAFAALCSIAASRLGGGMVDKIGRYRTVLTGTLVMVVSLVVMGLYTPTIVAYTASLAVFAAGSAISWAALLTLTVELLPDLKGTVSSLFTSAAFIGGALAPIMLNPVLTNWGTSTVHLASAALCSLIFLTITSVARDQRAHHVL